MTDRVFGAVDVGASGGRVVAGIVTGEQFRLDTVHRFTNAPVPKDGHLRWDISGIYREILDGLQTLGAKYAEVESIGIDTWAVDYGLLDDSGALLADPVSYRDDRTGIAIEELDRTLGRAQLFALNGLQHLPFTTIYQLEADRRGPMWPRVAHVALLPDLLAWWLTGIPGTELTNASTTGLLATGTENWSPEILSAVGVEESCFWPLRAPGEVLGPITNQVAKRTGLPGSVVVTTVGSHDTASAVVGVPATDREVAFVSSGTWSLVGTELDHPIVTPAAYAANFTNELGVDGRVRFLRNTGGLWLLQECQRAWAGSDPVAGLEQLLAEAAALPTGGPRIEVDDPGLLAPGDMPARIAAAAGSALSATRAATVRCIVDSLAAAYASTVEDIERLTGRAVRTVHLVGGGAQNRLLGQLTANLARRPVVAGPVEATCLGNVIVQARTAGAVAGDLDTIRQEIATTWPLVGYVPA
jgi:rhamnulokinase